MQQHEIKTLLERAAAEQTSDPGYTPRITLQVEQIGHPQPQEMVGIFDGFEHEQVRVLQNVQGQGVRHFLDLSILRGVELEPEPS